MNHQWMEKPIKTKNLCPEDFWGRLVEGNYTYAEMWKYAVIAFPWDCRGGELPAKHMNAVYGVFCPTKEEAIRAYENTPSEEMTLSKDGKMMWTAKLETLKIID